MYLDPMIQRLSASDACAQAFPIALFELEVRLKTCVPLEISCIQQLTPK